MEWMIALWLSFVVFTPCLFVNGIVDKNDFPFVIKPHKYSEQSPTNILTKNVEVMSLPVLHCHYLKPFNCAKVKLTNTGHTISIKLVDNDNDVPFIVGGPLFNNTFNFHEMHFHWGPNDCGSEHEINGHKYAMEIHIVHYKTAYGSFEEAEKYLDGVCVIAVFLEISEYDNLEMAEFIKDLDYLHEYESSMVRTFRKEFFWMRNVTTEQHYYSYHGSLTTTPFAQCVIWILFTKPISISRKQLSEFRELQSESDKVIKTNDRELQSFNNRRVIYVG